MTTPETSQNRQHVAVYAGSFDPITYGHLDVLKRSRHLFDAIVLGIGINPSKAPLFSQEERVAMARDLVKEMVAAEPDGAPVRVDQYQGLTMDFARSCGASAARGRRRSPPGPLRRCGPSGASR